jgi:hypothetical protein
MKGLVIMLFGVFTLSLFFVSPVLAKRCPPDSVQVGCICVDKHEASVWETTDKGTIKKIQKGKIKSAADLGAATQRGDDSDDYNAAGCPDTGNGCTDVYAVSIPGVTPSSRITWFQAAAACRNAGKRLLTNQEWQVTAFGTPDPGAAPGPEDCNTGLVGLDLTGERENCVSDMGTYDMVGNVWEWVADWVPRSTACGSWGGLSDDSQCLAGAATTGEPGALYRGGSIGTGTSAGVFALIAFSRPSGSGIDVGFRCGR